MTTQVEERGWIATDETFGARLALIRQHQGWGNLKEAAVACGIPVASWRSWETSGAMPRDIVGISAKIARQTGCSQAWLAGFPQPPSGTSVIA